MICIGALLPTRKSGDYLNSRHSNFQLKLWGAQLELKINKLVCG
jgi:hypothetical protein